MMLRFKKIVYCTLMALTFVTLYAQEKVNQLKKGNLALPESQQPGPLFGFGQNVIQKGAFQVSGAFDQNKGEDKNVVRAVPSFLYAVTDSFSLYLFSEIDLYHKQDGQRSSGMDNVAVQLEYEFYKNEKTTLTDSATIVGNVTIPTKNRNSLGFFFGPTLSRTQIDWYFFLSPGGLFNLSNKGTKSGNKYLFQCGVGRNIPSPSHLIWMVELELNGVFLERDEIADVIDPNSGGNVVYLGPSFWFSSRRVIIQGGIALPVYQQWYGNQKKIDYLAAVSVGLTF